MQNLCRGSLIPSLWASPEDKAVEELTFAEIAEVSVKVIGLGTALTYITGYLIVSHYLNGFGISADASDFLKPRYFYVGFLYMLAVCVIAVGFAAVQKFMDVETIDLKSSFSELKKTELQNLSRSLNNRSTALWFVIGLFFVSAVVISITFLQPEDMPFFLPIYTAVQLSFLLYLVTYIRSLEPDDWDYASRAVWWLRLRAGVIVAALSSLLILSKHYRGSKQYPPLIKIINKFTLAHMRWYYLLVLALLLSSKTLFYRSAATARLTFDDDEFWKARREHSRARRAWDWCVKAGIAMRAWLTFLAISESPQKSSKLPSQWKQLGNWFFGHENLPPAWTRIWNWLFKAPVETPHRSAIGCKRLILLLLLGALVYGLPWYAQRKPTVALLAFQRTSLLLTMCLMGIIVLNMIRLKPTQMSSLIPQRRMEIAVRWIGRIAFLVSLYISSTLIYSYCIYSRIPPAKSGGNYEESPLLTVDFESPSVLQAPSNNVTQHASSEPDVVKQPVPPSLVCKPVPGGKCIDLILIEETQDMMYFASAHDAKSYDPRVTGQNLSKTPCGPQNWLDSTNGWSGLYRPQIIAVRRADISWIADTGSPTKACQ